MPGRVNPLSSEIRRPLLNVDHQGFIKEKQFLNLQKSTKRTDFFMRNSGTIQMQIKPIAGSLLIQFTEMSGERRPRDSKKLCGPPLIARGLLVNQTDMSRDRRS